MMKPARAIAIVVCCCVVAGSAIPRAAQPPREVRAVSAGVRPEGIRLPSDAEIRAMLVERVDALAGQEDGVGLVVGLIGPEGRRVIAYGHLDRGDPRPLNGDTVFEIASVSKVFTALLLADMVRRGEVALADPVVDSLPAGVKIPGRNGHRITFLDLATHTSGLPFMPDRLPDIDDPAATPSDPARIYRFLAHCRLTRDIGTGWDYSNLGYWLLGKALAARAGTDYASLLRKRVLAPLRLRGTATTVSPGLKTKLAVGHDAALEPARPLSTIPVYSSMVDVLNLVSTTDDLLTLLSVAMGYERSPLSPAMADLLKTRRPISPGEVQALGWVVRGAGDDTLILHEGGALGYASALAWDPRLRVGVVVLSNQVAGVGDIARHMMRPAIPLEKPTTTKRIEIALDPAVLDTYAGRYEAEGEGLFLVAREGDFLTIRLPDDWGLPRLRLRPYGTRDFFTAELPLRVTFQTGADGSVNGALIHPPRGQDAVLAKRIGPEK